MVVTLPAHKEFRGIQALLSGLSQNKISFEWIFGQTSIFCLIIYSVAIHVGLSLLYVYRVMSCLTLVEMSIFLDYDETLDFKKMWVFLDLSCIYASHETQGYWISMEFLGHQCQLYYMQSESWLELESFRTFVEYSISSYYIPVYTLFMISNEIFVS